MKDKKNNVLKTVGFLGSGNMAQAIIKCLLSSCISKKIKIIVYDINPQACNAARLMGADIARDATTLAEKCEYIIIAVKPQVVNEALKSIRGEILKKKVFISIAAGVRIKKICDIVGARTLPVIRVMPNTPALIGEGACAYAVSSSVSRKTEKFTLEMLKTFCKVYVKVKEEELDTVTALSGSGPAYFFYFVEAMLEAAAKMGFNRETARKLIIQTMSGSAKLLENTSEEPECLRAKVTSKGGTTQRAVENMERKGIKRIIIDALMAAKKRAEELSK